MTTHKQKKSLKLPIWLMVWPAGAFVVALFLAAATNLMFSSSNSDLLYGSPSMAQSIVNIIVFILGGASILLGLPSFVVGLVLLILWASENNVPAQPVQPVIVQPVARRYSGQSIAGMVLGISGVMTAAFVIGFFAGIVGICLSAHGMKHSPAKGIAIAGLVTSIVATSLGLLYIGIYIAAIVHNINTPDVTPAYHYTTY